MQKIRTTQKTEDDDNVFASIKHVFQANYNHNYVITSKNVILHIKELYVVVIKRQVKK